MTARTRAAIPARWWMNTTGTIWLLLTHNPGDTGEAPDQGAETRRRRAPFGSPGARTTARRGRRPRTSPPRPKTRPGAGMRRGRESGIQIQHGPHRGRLVIPCDHSFPGPDRAAGEPADRRRLACHLQRRPRPDLEARRRGAPADERVPGRRTGRRQGRSAAQHAEHRRKPTAARSPLSHDGGQTWTAPEYPPELVEPRCQASLLRYNWPNGKEPGRMLFSNPASTAPEQPDGARQPR